MNGYNFRDGKYMSGYVFFFLFRLVYEWGRVRGLQSHVRTQNHGKLPTVYGTHICAHRKSRKQVHWTPLKVKLKLTSRHINRHHICFNIKSFSVNPLLWMNVILDFICIGFSKWKYVSPRGIEHATPCCPARYPNYSDIGPVEKILLKL